eukprot:Blabericola_migrator_1__9964@NODE_550_length_7654_cov_145_973903_g415_i0_p2_GENE_NODE_550_length_7654_cov_145_973903_g415_i0NODE_550_length_7654_cov_145_973903_g415_i0_p2_ORF_typecomplete_len361_score33_90_NODE_550_length_7654_cov_145_973903_g415_i058616943
MPRRKDGKKPAFLDMLEWEKVQSRPRRRLDRDISVSFSGDGTPQRRRNSNNTNEPSDETNALRRRRSAEEGRYLTPVTWDFRPWNWVNWLDDTRRSRLQPAIPRNGPITSQYIQDLVPSRPQPLTDYSWTKKLNRRRQGRMIIVDCFDIALTYGETRGVIDFAGINVLMHSFLSAADNLPPMKLVMFEHEWQWWKTRQYRSWRGERHFLEEAEALRLVERLDSGNSYVKESGILYHVVEVLDDPKFRPVRPAEPFNTNAPCALWRNFSPQELAASCMTQSQSGRLLGQVRTLAEYVTQYRAVLMTNDYKMFSDLSLIDQKLFDYISCNRYLYSIVDNQLIVQQDSLRSMAKSHSSLNVTP